MRVGLLFVFGSFCFVVRMCMVYCCVVGGWVGLLGYSSVPIPVIALLVATLNLSQSCLVGVEVLKFATFMKLKCP